MSALHQVLYANWPCRKKMVEALKEQFRHLDLAFAIGGQISFDVFPKVLQRC